MVFLDYIAMVLWMSFTKALINAVITKRKNQVREYLNRAYPNLYHFMVESVNNKICPLCGLRMRTRFGIVSHLQGSCAEDWYELFSKMYGKTRISEEEAFQLLNEIRSKNGLDSYWPVNYSREPDSFRAGRAGRRPDPCQNQGQNRCLSSYGSI